MDLTENFTSAEFRCKDGTPVPSRYLNNVQLLAQNLQSLRDFGLVDKPIRINSGFRTIDYNRSVGGVDNSYHTLAMAADISVQDTSPEKVYCAVERLIARGDMQDGGLGYYGPNGHIHYDIGAPRRWTKPVGLAVPICEEDEVTPEELDKLNKRLEQVEAFNKGIAVYVGAIGKEQREFHEGVAEYVAVLADMAEKGKAFDVGIARSFGVLAEKQVESFDRLMTALSTHITIHNQSSGPLDRETATFLDEMASPLADVSRIGKHVAALARLKTVEEETE